MGGDFYKFFELDDGRVGFAVGDATGKGVSAAFVMSATCALLRGVATASGSSPGEVLARVNEAVLARIPPNMFVTCFYCILEPKSGSLLYANDGHNLPCCCHNEHAVPVAGNIEETQVEEAVHTEVRAGDPIYAAMDMTPSERDEYIRGISAPEYRAETRRLMEMRVEGPEEDE